MNDDDMTTSDDLDEKDDTEETEGEETEDDELGSEYGEEDDELPE